MFNVAEIILK